MTIPNRAQQIGWGEMNEMKDSKSYQKPIISRNQKKKFRPLSRWKISEISSVPYLSLSLSPSLSLSLSLAIY